MSTKQASRSISIYRNNKFESVSVPVIGECTLIEPAPSVQAIADAKARKHPPKHSFGFIIGGVLFFIAGIAMLFILFSPETSRQIEMQEGMFGFVAAGFFLMVGCLLMRLGFRKKGDESPMLYKICASIFEKPTHKPIGATLIEQIADANEYEKAFALTDRLLKNPISIECALEKAFRCTGMVDRQQVQKLCETLETAVKKALDIPPSNLFIQYAYAYASETKRVPQAQEFCYLAEGKTSILCKKDGKFMLLDLRLQLYCVENDGVDVPVSTVPQWMLVEEQAG